MTMTMGLLPSQGLQGEQVRQLKVMCPGGLPQVPLLRGAFPGPPALSVFSQPLAPLPHYVPCLALEQVACWEQRVLQAVLELSLGHRAVWTSQGAEGLLGLL